MTSNRITNFSLKRVDDRITKGCLQTENGVQRTSKSGVNTFENRQHF